MPNYLIEVAHSDDRDAGIIARKTFRKTGSHFITNADWGCPDDDHRAVMIVDVESKEQAMQILPPIYRRHAKITSLMKVSREISQ